jgi:signal transduction histidine kinase
MTEDDERRLVHAGRLALVGQLTRGAAHELNNPLFVILGLLELVSATVDTSSKAYERIMLARSTGDEMKEILRALLDLARPDPPDAEPERIPLDELAREAVTTARRLTLAKDVELVEQYGDGAVEVVGRRGELRQLLVTLLANGQEAQKGGGRVTLDVSAERAEAVVTVSDRGPGIPPALADDVFRPLAAGEGPGLGLATVRLIARRHGGDAELGSSADGGTAVVVRLPLAS